MYGFEGKFSDILPVSVILSYIHPNTTFRGPLRFPKHHKTIYSDALIILGHSTDTHFPLLRYISSISSLNEDQRKESTSTRLKTYPPPKLKPIPNSSYPKFHATHGNYLFDPLTPFLSEERRVLLFSVILAFWAIRKANFSIFFCN